MFKLLRFYSAVSFGIIFVTAALLTLFYRQVTIHWVDHLAETNSLAMAQTVLNSVKPELMAYMDATASERAKDGGNLKEIPVTLESRIQGLTQGTAVGAIKIYNQRGQALLSTRQERIDSMACVQSALEGRAFNVMIYRDTFNRFEGTTEEDNLMHTCIPIRDAQNASVLGVLEIHMDMNHLVEENNKVLFTTMIGAEVILALLYAVLIVAVRHAENIIESQQKTIEERTASLEVLSERLLQNEEQKKQKIAIELHEGLAQTLSAIKFNVESSNARIKACAPNEQPLESIVPVLQEAIQEVRTIATELRPSTLDELGLLPTINWYCREFGQKHQEINVEREISLQEGAIPVPLKIVIYRIIESTFKNIAHYSGTDQIRLALQRAGDKIHLRISHTPDVESSADAPSHDAGADHQFRFVEMMERTTLSGGTFRASRNDSGWIMLHASWAC